MALPLEQFLPEHFINREISWLDFNARVLEEAQDETVPLLERIKFLAIFASNLDEFFMVRVAGLREQAFGNDAPQNLSLDGLFPIEQLSCIAVRAKELVEQQYACWNDSILPALADSGIRIVSEEDLKKRRRKWLDDYFQNQIFPVLTPMAIDPSHPAPHFHNRGIYLAASLKRIEGLGPEHLFAVVQLPQVLPRFVAIEPGSETEFVLLEDIIAHRLPELFGGYEVLNSTTFRITRDMDMELFEQEADDLLHSIESRLRARQRSEAVRLEISSSMAEDIRRIIIKDESIRVNGESSRNDYDEVYNIDGLLDMTGLNSLIQLIDQPALRDPPFSPQTPLSFQNSSNIFKQIAKQDILLHHPYDSFDPVVEFICQAATDPKVLAIKQTLYRTSGDSSIVKALINAAENGKHVTALVELKARFDEANNIVWARQMEQAGVHVVYGFRNLKTHCKLALVVRQEEKKLQRYVHLGTGNYNPATARVYTDMGLFTIDQAIAEDASALFNFLTGYSQGYHYQKLSVAPEALHRRTLELIEQQTQLALLGKPSRIFAKLNSLVDRRAIEAMYRASQAGVKVDLVVRGICCLRPGLAGISENIHVRSIIDRFLEHSRIMVFGAGKNQEIFFSSADWMPRNFGRRVEVMFPVEDPAIRETVIQQLIPAYMADNQRARILQADGSYSRPKLKKNELPFRSQHVLSIGSRNQSEETANKTSQKKSAVSLNKSSSTKKK